MVSLTEIVTQSLDERQPASELARQARHSRSHFFRMFRAVHAEAPAAMRRRLALERAAWQLTHTQAPVTAIAFDAAYSSLEGFTRAFKSAFRLSPSLYRRLRPTHFHLSSPNGIHFLTAAQKGNPTMDLFELFAGTDTFHTRNLLEHCQGLTDEQLDRPIPHAVKLLPWETPEKNVRELLERLVYTKEVWVAAMSGGEMPQPPATPSSAAELLQRFQTTDAQFQAILRDVQHRNAWDDTFVDALCEPPEKFTFGATFAHVITFNTHRRLTALDAVRRLGVAIEGFGCPSEFEAAQAK